MISFSSRNLLTSLSSSKKLASAVSNNFVTVTSLDSKKRAAAQPRYLIALNSKYLVGISSVYRKLVITVSSRYFATDSSLSCAFKNLVTVTSF